MKTILYNPIFINPQAYFVFPQLYDIEKGDSFIEPAAYAGQLMIENLTDNTKVMLENNVMQVDFTQFAGKRIRINQYTNIGAVVLGEWLLPEGEPSGPSFHESLVDAWVMSGLSNSTKPTEIVGVKGNSLQLKNFAYALNSGFGKYATDFNSWNKRSEFADFTVTHDIIHITNVIRAGAGFINISSSKGAQFKAKVEGINDIALWYQYYDTDNNIQRIEIKEDGIYTFPKTNINSLDFFTEKVGTCNITITQLPSAYEGALVFDGVDDYGICTGLPILDDYTVICRRVIEGNRSANVVASKSVTTGKGAFIFEIFDTKNSTWSFGVQNDVDINYNDSVSWQTKKSYNGEKNLAVGSGSDTDTLCLGILREKDSRCLKGAIYYFALYDKSLTPEEIEEEKVKLENYWEGGKNELA